MIADILVDALSEIDLCLDEPEFLQLYSADVRNLIASLRDDMVILCAEPCLSSCHTLGTSPCVYPAFPNGRRSTSPETQDIDGRVHVSVVAYAASAASPFPLIQTCLAFRSSNAPAFCADLRRELFIYLHIAR